MNWKNYVFLQSNSLFTADLSPSYSLDMRERRTATGFKVAQIATEKTNGAKSTRKEKTNRAEVKKTPAKSNKRAAPTQEESEDELEDFGNVDIDINSDDDEVIQEGDLEESDDEVEEFPEDQSDNEEGNLAEANEDETDDDYMAGDSLDEAEWDEDVKERYDKSLLFKFDM